LKKWPKTVKKSPKEPKMKIGEPETFQHPLRPNTAARQTKKKKRQMQATQVLLKK
jgi:hypothetical protein